MSWSRVSENVLIDKKRKCLNVQWLTLNSICQMHLCKVHGKNIFTQHSHANCNVKVIRSWAKYLCGLTVSFSAIWSEDYGQIQSVYGWDFYLPQLSQRRNESIPDLLLRKHSRLSLLLLLSHLLLPVSYLPVRPVSQDKGTACCPFTSPQAYMKTMSLK